MRSKLFHLFACSLLATSAQASEEPAAKIEYLLSAIGNSECVFIRNGKEHDAAAEDHLRMKYRRGKKSVKSVESFIDRNATKSSLSGDLYLIRCPGQDERSTAVWITEKLSESNTPEEQ